MTSMATTAYFTDDNLLMTEDDIMSAMAALPPADDLQGMSSTGAWLAQLPNSSDAFLHPDQALGFDYASQPAMLFSEPEQMLFQPEDLLDPQLFAVDGKTQHAGW